MNTCIFSHYSHVSLLLCIPDIANFIFSSMRYFCIPINLSFFFCYAVKFFTKLWFCHILHINISLRKSLAVLCLGLIIPDLRGAAFLRTHPLSHESSFPICLLGTGSAPTSLSTQHCALCPLQSLQMAPFLPSGSWAMHLCWSVLGWMIKEDSLWIVKALTLQSPPISGALYLSDFVLPRISIPSPVLRAFGGLLFSVLLGNLKVLSGLQAEQLQGSSSVIPIS